MAEIVLMSDPRIADDGIREGSCIIPGRLESGVFPRRLTGVTVPVRDQNHCQNGKQDRP